MTTSRRRRRPFLEIVLALAVLAPTPAVAAARREGPDVRDSRHELVSQSASKLSEANPVSVLPDRLNRVAVTRKVNGKLKVQTYPTASKAAAKRLVASVSDDAGVIAAAIDTPTRALGDQHRYLQYGLDHLEAEAARRVHTGAGVTLAVLDTGVEGTHPDLSANLRQGAEFLRGTGVSSGNGWTDENGHGTHVAGIAAAGVNGFGVEGLAPDLAILPVRVLDQNGSGHNSDVAAGIVWATDHGADVINLSLGSPAQDANLQAAVDYARSRGVVVVAAAGDSWFQGNPTIYPAAYDDVIAVAATNQYQGRAGFSQSGDWIDVTAPGEEVVSTYIGNSYESMNGTSMAASFVAASAAMLLGSQPNLTPAQVQERLELTATDLGPLGFDPDFGHGLVSPLRAMTQALVPAPRLMSVTGGDGSLAIEWAANPENTLPVLEHRIRVSAAGETTRTYTAPGDGRSYFVSDATNGTTYTVSVSAVTANGSSRASGALSATPRATRVPMAPSAPLLTGVEAGDRSATLTWDAPASSGTAPISTYELTATSPTAPTATTTVEAENLTARLQQLENGSDYTFTITATSADGTSPVSNSRTATPARPTAAPSAPVLASATAGGGSVELVWDAPSSEGTAPVTGYEAIATSADSSPVTARFPGDARTGRIPGLSSGVAYTVFVRAISADGTSADSAYRSVTPSRVKVAPGAPTVLDLRAGDESVTATWAPPETSGSAAVATYELLATAPSAPMVTIDFLASARTGTLTGLRNDVSYTVTMRTHTADGVSPYAMPREVTPFRKIVAPSAPTLTGATPGDTTIDLTWSGSLEEGTAPVTSYEVRATTNGLDPIVVTLPTGARSTTLTGLKNETEYTVTVRAISADGTSPATSPRTVTPDRLRIAPATPELTHAAAGDTVIDLTWAAPTSEGTAPVTGYEVTATSPTAQTVSKTLPADARGTTLTDLVNGTTYTVHVRATSADGPSSAAIRDLTPHRPMWAPSAPMYLSAGEGDTRATAYWYPSETPGSSPVTGYELRISSAAGTRTETFGANTYSATLTSLTNRVQYTLAVRALTDDGNSAYSEPALVTPRPPRISPGAPTLTSATAGDGSVSFRWTAPSSTGSAPIATYDVMVMEGRNWTEVKYSADHRSGTITGLTNGREYTVSVAAVTADGWTYSNVLRATPQRRLVPPGYPTITSVTTHTRGVTFAWTPPADTGSAPLTGYTWGLHTAGSTPGTLSFHGTTDLATRSVTLNDLAAGQTYTLMVRAVSADGTGSYGYASEFTTPAPPPPSIALDVKVPSPAAGVVTIDPGFSSVSNGYTVGVELRIDGGTPVATDYTKPYSFSLDTKNYSNGSHRVHVQAKNSQTGVTSVSSKLFTIANQTVTLSVPPAVRYNTDATFTAQIGTTTQPSLLDNQSVTLQRYTSGAWKNVATATTNRSGTATHTYRMTRPGKFRMKMADTWSSAKDVDISGTLSASYTKASDRVTFKGTLTPAAGRPVYLERSNGSGNWHPVAQTNDPTFNSLAAFLPQGTTRWRVRSPASEGYTGVTSTTHTITR